MKTNPILAFGQQLLLAKVVHAQQVAHSDQRHPAEIMDCVHFGRGWRSMDELEAHAVVGQQKGVDAAAL